MRACKWQVGLAIVAALVAGSPGAASAAGQWTLGFGVGAALPSGDFGDAMAAGFDGGVFADYWPTEVWAVGFDIAGSGHAAEDDFEEAFNNFTEAVLIASGATTADSDLDISVSILRFGVRGTLQIPTGGPVAPYVQGGGGIYRINEKINGTITIDGAPFDIDEAEDESKFGLNGAMGVRFRASPRVSVAAQAQIHNVFTEEESTEYFGFGAMVSFVVGGPS